MKITKTDVIMYAVIVALVLCILIILVSQFQAQQGKAEPEERDIDVEISYIVDKSPEPELTYPITQAERDLIAETVHHEAKGEGVAGMAAVAEVILNRLQDGRFGASISEVCTPGQFHGLKKAGTETVTQNAYAAVSRVFDEGLYAGTCGALYFCTPNTDPDEIKPGIIEVARIGRHVFYID